VPGAALSSPADEHGGVNLAGVAVTLAETSHADLTDRGGCHQLDDEGRHRVRLYIDRWR